jgi:hypothetical protein
MFGNPDDPNLARFKSSVDPKTMKLRDAIALVKSYFQACSDPKVRKFDESHCASLSSRIHIATITPGDGFAWVSGHQPGQA